MELCLKFVKIHVVQVYMVILWDKFGHGTCSVHSLETSTSQQLTSAEIAFLCNSPV